MITKSPAANHAKVWLAHDDSLTAWYKSRAAKEARSVATLIRAALLEYARRRGYREE